MNIRYSPEVTARLAASGYPRSPLVSEMAVREAAEVERAIARVLVISPPEAMRIVAAEAEHRREIGMTDRAAWLSVGDDLVAGRWQP